MVREARVAAEPAGQGGDVQGVAALALQLVVVDTCAVAEHRLAHGVDEVGGAIGSGEALDHARLAAPAGDDQGARVGDRGRSARGGDVQHVDRLADHRAGRDRDHRRVLGEGGVEVGEDRGSSRRHAPEVGHRLGAVGPRQLRAGCWRERPSTAAASRRDSAGARRPLTNTTSIPRRRLARHLRQHARIGGGLRVGGLEAGAGEPGRAACVARPRRAGPAGPSRRSERRPRCAARAATRGRWRACAAEKRSKLERRASLSSITLGGHGRGLSGTGPAGSFSSHA